jgi:hypothetical protein
MNAGTGLGHAQSAQTLSPYARGGPRCVRPRATVTGR